LTVPLRPGESLPTRQHYVPKVSTPTAHPEQKQEKKPKKEKKEKRDKKEKKHKKEKGEKKDSSSTTTKPIPVEEHSKPQSSTPQQISSPPPVANNSSPYHLGKSPVAPKEEKPSDKSSKKSKKSKKSQEAPPQTAQLPSVTIIKFKPLTQDECLSSIYELRNNPKEPRKIMIVFAFKNITKTTTNQDLTKISWTFNEQLNIKPTANSSVIETLQPDATSKQNQIFFDVASFQQPLKLTGKLTYNSKELPITVLIPSSSFFNPEPLNKEQFIQLLRDTTFTSQSVSIKYKEDFKSVVAFLSGSLHLAVITCDDKTAAFCGRSVQNHILAIYIKQISDGSAALDLKCTDPTIGASFSSEIETFYNN